MASLKHKIIRAIDPPLCGALRGANIPDPTSVIAVMPQSPAPIRLRCPHGHASTTPREELLHVLSPSTRTAAQDAAHADWIGLELTLAMDVRLVCIGRRNSNRLRRHRRRHRPAAPRLPPPPAMLRAFRVARAASSLLARCPARSPSVRALGLSWRPFASQPLPVPAMGESITEGTVAEWLVNDGQGVTEDQVLVQLETDKIVVDVRAERPGVFLERTAEEGEVVAVGAQLGLIDYEATAPAEAPSAEAPPAEEPPAEEPPAQSPPAEAPPTQAPPAPAHEPEPVGQSEPIAVYPPRNMTDSGERRVKMTRMRKRIAERLKEAQNTAAMLTTFNEMDMSALIDLRKEFKDAFLKRHGAKLGFMSAFVKACTVALLEQPEVNAFIDGDDIVYRDYVDISVAVSTPKGLVVPAVRGCENMNFATIEKTIVSLGERARSGELTLEEMQGGTFTISNGGVFGSLLSTPILNMPQSAILGMHIIQKRPVVVDDQVVIRPMMYVALSYDHRLIDGREAVTFLRRVKTLIEDPRRLLLEIDI